MSRDALAALAALLLLVALAATVGVAVHLNEDGTPPAATRHELVRWDISTVDEAEPAEFPRAWAWTSPVAEGSLTEAISSWNVLCPPGTGVRAQGRVRRDGGWSPWLDFGAFGEVPPADAPAEFASGRVAVDVLELREPADGFQLRLIGYAFSPGGDVPTPLRAAVALSGPGEPDAVSASAWTGDLGVPFIPQRDAGEGVAARVCSPTAVAMVLSHLGRPVTPAESAAALYDREHGIFGNWNRAAAYAGSLGFDATIERFATLDAAADLLADGVPLVASVRFGPGECPSFVMDSTAGHLIVLRGRTPSGDFVVNDPADPDRGGGAVYDAADLRRAWIENAGGVAYVIRPAG